MRSELKFISLACCILLVMYMVGTGILDLGRAIVGAFSP
jgi:hypothetical protein